MANTTYLLENEIANINANNWQHGFEETLHSVYHMWNAWKTGYDDAVINNGSRFLPSKSLGN